MGYTFFTEKNISPKIKKETAERLGVSVEVLEAIHKRIKEKNPKYNKGYDYNIMLLHLSKRRV